MLFFTYNTDVLHEKGEKGIIYIYINTIYSSYYIYTHARGAAPTPLRHAEPFRLVVPSCLLSPPLYPPTVRSLAPLPFIPSPVPRSFVVVCCALDAATLRRSLSVDHKARPPPFRAAICKIFFQACEAFRLFRAVLPSYFVPAL